MADLAIAAGHPEAVTEVEVQEQVVQMAKVLRMEMHITEQRVPALLNPDTFLDSSYPYPSSLNFWVFYTCLSHFFLHTHLYCIIQRILVLHIMLISYLVAFVGLYCSAYL